MPARANEDLMNLADEFLKTNQEQLAPNVPRPKPQAFTLDANDHIDVKKA